MYIYLDVCCLNRPFDDQMQERIKLESEAILIILKYCQAGRWRLLGSDVIDFEISRIPDSYRQLKLKIILIIVHNEIKVDKEIVTRTRDIIDIGSSHSMPCILHVQIC